MGLFSFDTSISSDKKLAKSGKRVFVKLRRILDSEKDHQAELETAIASKDVSKIYNNLSGLIIEFKEELDLLTDIRHIEDVLNRRLIESEKNIEKVIIDLEAKGLRSEKLKQLLTQVQSEEGRIVDQKRSERYHEKKQLRRAA